MHYFPDLGVRRVIRAFRAMLLFTVVPYIIPHRRTPPTCRRSRTARRRAEKRTVLYDAMSAYVAHFAPALDTELSAQQDTAIEPRTCNSAIIEHDRLYSSIVFSIHPPQRLRQAELLAVSDGTHTVQATALPDARLAIPVGSAAAQTLSELAASGKQVSIAPAFNSLPYERAVGALETFAKPQPSAGGIVRLIAASFVESPPINTYDLQQFRIQPGGQWHELARETVVGLKQEELNRVIKQLPLNRSQRGAVQRALRARLTLIQGPPGTGKTVTAAHLIAACISLRTGPVLACASSNIATDNLLRKIRKAAPRANIVRIGQVSAIAEDQWSISLDYLLERNGEVRQARNALQRGQIRTAELVQLEQEVAKTILRKTDIVVTTCVSCGREELKSLEFPVVVVDEATQATEPDVLIPLTATGITARQMILIGDHHQLPPTVLSRGDGERLQTSLFLRLWSCGVGCERLQVQYRMHPEIAMFPAAHFYFGTLRDGVSQSERILPPSYENLMAMASNKRRVLFCNVSTGKEEKDRFATDAGGKATSFYNRKEVEVVAGIVNVLKTPPTRTKQGKMTEACDVGVISPYAAQVRHLRDTINRTNDAIEVNTVDAYQGREKDVIILSTVRSNSLEKLGFLQDWRRLNVALTRARYLLLVVGHQNTIVTNAHWASWLSYVKTQGGVLNFTELST